MSNKQYEQSNEWKQGYRAQAEDARRDGIIYGRTLAGRYARNVLCTRDIEEAVADALGDIWIGTIAWNADAVGLPRAVQDVLKSRVPRMIRRALAHEPIFVDNEEGDELRIDDEPLQVVADVVGEDERERFLLRDLARQLTDELRRRTRGEWHDPDVRALLGALCDGVGEPRELAARLDISEAELRNVERRLVYLAESLPAALCPDFIMAEMTPTRRAPMRCRRAENTTAARRDVFDLARLLGLVA